MWKSIIPFSCNLHCGHSAFLIFVSKTGVKCMCIPISLLKRKKNLSCLTSIQPWGAYCTKVRPATSQAACQPEDTCFCFGTHSWWNQLRPGRRGHMVKNRPSQTSACIWITRRPCENADWFSRCGLWHDFFCFQRTPSWCQRCCPSDHTLSNKDRT